MADHSVAETNSGKLCGAVKDGIHIFKGIPYGAPADVGHLLAMVNSFGSLERPRTARMHAV